MLKERQKTILSALMEEFIETASPVSSHALVDKFHFPFSPATVRNELLVLDDAGFLEQPHTSAGRVPTDKGYRFYIESVFELMHEPSDDLAVSERHLISQISALRGEGEFLERVARIVSEISQGFTVAGFSDELLYYKTGMSEVLQEPEFEDRKLVQEFSELTDVIDEEIRRMFDPKDFSSTRVFVGSENPIKNARHYGMVVSSVSGPARKETLVAILGPKRMDYKKNVSLLDYLDDILGR